MRRYKNHTNSSPTRSAKPLLQQDHRPRQDTKSKGYACTACAVGIAPEDKSPPTKEGYRLVTYFFARSYWAASSPSGSCLVVWSSSVILPSPTL